MAHAGPRGKVVLSEFIDPEDWLGWVEALGIIISKELFSLEERRTSYRKFLPFRKKNSSSTLKAYFSLWIECIILICWIES